MAMRSTTVALLLALLLVVSLHGLVHAEDFPEGSIVRAAEPTEHDKNNPLFKIGKLTRQNGQNPLSMGELQNMLATTLDGQTFQPLTDMPPPHPDVVTHDFTDTQPDNIVRLPIGVPTSIYCLFQNHGPSPLTVTHVAGSLNTPDSKFYLQNFTIAPVGFVVPPGEEVTVQYEFTPKTILRPAPFQVAHTIFYEGEGDEDVYSTTFFNKSILVVAPTVTK